MARELEVYFERRLVGTLVQDDSGQLRFTYHETWLADPASIPISWSLPLRSEPFNHRETRPFFAGLLPEAEKRELVARALGVSDRNDFALLDRIGGECAGAVTLLHSGETPPPVPKEADYRLLDDGELKRILDVLPDRPLLAGEAGVRLSLAGAQDKLPVLVVDGRIALPLHGAPSTHILKPPIRRFEDTVFNERFCLALAKAVGLNAVSVETRSVGDRPFLLVARYDRVRGGDGAVRRLHQEDFCQALGIVPELKYQTEGGPNLHQCFDLVRNAVARPVLDLACLLDAVLFNLFIGNRDAHGKNYSLLFVDEGLQLAPLYDVVSTDVYPGLSPRLAMKIGDKDETGAIYPRHWERFAKEAGLAFPQVRRRLLDLAQALPEAARDVQQRFVAEGKDRPIIARVVDVIDRETRLVIDRFASMGKV
ncbi:MAG: type II toxin-antitoxin system HipA family toxin [Alphaproteobacteria bacterium]